MKPRLLITAAIVICIFLAMTGIATNDRGTWMMEVTPVVIALPILWISYRRFPLTPLLYFLIFIHAVVLIMGGYYTYAKVPFGFWLEHIFSLSRNPYDKIGHFLQGFVPALLAREIFIRGSFVRGKKMTQFLSVCLAMTISACYELIEWAAAVGLGQGAEQFLGTQGDSWDTQSDMLMALIGAVVALITCSRWQNRQMEKLNGNQLVPRPIRRSAFRCHLFPPHPEK